MSGRQGFDLAGCRAVITGASSGLGAESAKQLAPHAHALLLVARRREPLEALQADLIASHPALTVRICAADLATEAGRAQLLEQIRESDFRPDLLINNAGHGDYGPVLSADLARLQSQIDLNVTALVMLTHALLPMLTQAPRGISGILNVSSLAGTLPLPEAAVYAATKSFVTSFSEALRIELRRQNVVVTAVSPGPTPTNFRHVATRSDGADTDRSGDGFLTVAPEEVVRQALRALERGRANVHPGWGPTLAAWLFRVAPRPLLRWFLERRLKRADLRKSSHGPPSGAN